MRRASSVVLALLLAAIPARAGGPTLQQVSGPEAVAKGTLEGLSMDEQGVVRPGPAFDAVPLQAPTSWAALKTDAGWWIGTGNDATVVRVGADGKVERVPTGEGLMATALAPLPGGAVAAAVFPGARIVKISADGKVETLATLPVEHVWALSADERGRLTAATGMPGALFQVDPLGAVEKVLDVGDDHARCLARRGEEWLVGTSPKGLLLSVKGKDRRVLRDLEPQEVVGLVPAADGGIYVAANADQTGGNAQAIGNLLKQLVEPPETRPGQEPTARPSLQDGRLMLLEPSGLLATLWEAKQVAVLALAADGAGAVAGTYPSGRLVRVEAGRPSSVLADLPEAEASVVLGGPRGLEAVVTSNPAVLHRRGTAAGKGTFTSAPLDAGATARWGRVAATGSGVRSLEFRAGETAEPDATWGAWAPATGFDGAAGSVTATARFVQLRVALEGDGAELRDLTVVTDAPNRAPTLGEFSAMRPGEADKASPAREITWKAVDADGDRLHTSIHAQREGSPHWLELVKDEVLEKPTWTWDTAGIPDGTYRIRVVLSDAPDNAPDRARSVTHVSGPLRIDNTPPQARVTARVAGARLLVEGEATDPAGGRIAKVRVSVDGSPWQPVPPKDGLYDSPTERFEASLPSPGPGAHDVVVQASDADANLGAAAAVVGAR